MARNSSVYGSVTTALASNETTTLSSTTIPPLPYGSVTTALASNETTKLSSTTITSFPTTAPTSGGGFETCCSRPSPIIVGAALNFTNSIIGAGCFGLAGAISISGGLVSVVSILFFGWMTKLSFDLTIALSIENTQSRETSSSSLSSSSATFEALGFRAYGNVGSVLVGLSKFGFSFGCMVAYIVIIKENFSSGIRSLLKGYSHDSSTNIDDPDADDDDDDNYFHRTTWLLDDNISTLLLCTTIILPLSCLRSVTPFEKFSVLKIGTVVLITVVLFILLITDVSTETQSVDSDTSDLNGMDDSTTELFYKHWVEIRSGFIRNAGTFVLTYTANHTIHMVFLSLDAPMQTLYSMKQITAIAIVLSSMLIVPIGLLPYVTFWERTTGNLFELYQPSPLVDGARLMLSVVMILTYPMPFFSCRELLVLWLPKSWWKRSVKLKNDRDDDVKMERNDGKADTKRHSDDSEYLLLQPKPTSPTKDSPSLMNGGDANAASATMYLENDRTPFWYHTTLTVGLWGTTMYLALSAPSLVDVLNLVGCATGTMISFVLPGMFAVKLQQRVGCTSLLLLGVGVPVGCLGTYYSMIQLLHQ